MGGLLYLSDEDYNKTMDSYGFVNITKEDLEAIYLEYKDKHGNN